MAEWKISVERIEVFAHPNADRMEVARVGLHQVVVGKGSYRTGDLVAFAPKRSVLPSSVWDNYYNPDTGECYLRNGRVDSIRLRGELSEGVTLPEAWVTEKLGVASLLDIPLGEDLSERLGISLFVYPVSPGLEGKIVQFRETAPATHDVESITIFAGEFAEDEEVLATEKLHGSQCAVLIPEGGDIIVGSKYLFYHGISFLEDKKNAYWRAVRASGIEEQARSRFPGQRVQAFGEILPFARGFSYGFTRDKPVLFLFRLEVGGLRLSRCDAVAALPEQRWAPVLYQGPFNRDVLKKIARGKETVSEQKLHIREGIVVEPVTPRLAREGFPLLLKVVNPDFRDDDSAPS